MTSSPAPTPRPGSQVLGLPRTERLAGSGDGVQGPLAGHGGGTRPAHRVCLSPAETVTPGLRGALSWACVGRGVAGRASGTGPAPSRTGATSLESVAPVVLAQGGSGNRHSSCPHPSAPQPGGPVVTLWLALPYVLPMGLWQPGGASRGRDSLEWLNQPGFP